MGKNQPKTAHVRAVKGKTPEQLRKRDLNVTLAKWRLKKLQLSQKLARAIRERHAFQGSDESVLDQYMAMVESECNAFIAARFQAKMEAVQAKFVAEAMIGPASIVLVKWLAGRDATYDRVNRFFNERPALKRVASAVDKIA